ncbi:MAG: hypothetical protein JSV22_07010 [Bacteroidales bacterium]|nr:MAG: hypothetical protein JSV22_07010 [Bacteroidales bacterium]
MRYSKTDIYQQLPDSIYDWNAESIVYYNTKENLYDYINGGAELYISYGFKSAISRKYLKSEQPEVVVEIFDMNKPENAYGVFSNTRYEEDYTYGQGSQYVEGTLFFWKSKYYVSIMTTEETDESKKLVNELGKIISEKIEEEGKKPDILDLLPSNELDRSSILYFHHYIWINSFYFISDENLLLIDDNTDAVLAKYGPADKRSYLLIVKYDDKEAAGKAYNNFIEYYFPEAEFKNISQLEDQTWMAINLINSTFFGIFNGRSEEYVSHLMSEIELTYKKAIIDK